MDELGRQIRTLGHPQVGPHAQGLAVGTLQHAQLQVETLGDRGGHIGQSLWGGDVGRCGHQLAGQLHTAAEGIVVLQAFPGFLRHPQQGDVAG